jgi:ribonuclease D
MTDQHIYVDTNEALQQALTKLAQANHVTVDTEFERRTTFFPKPALLQVGDGESIYLFDPLYIDNFDELFSCLKTKSILLHACREDFEVFRELSNITLNSVSDTQVAASLLGYDSQIAYQRLVESILGIELDKSETCSDWLERPLSDNQLSYAISDVLHLEPLFNNLLNRLQEKGREDWFVQEMQAMSSLLEAPKADEYFFKIKGIGRCNAEQLSFAYDFIVWRDELARRKNVPRGFILKDKALVQIIKSFGKHKDNDLNHLRKLPDVPHGFLKRHIPSLENILRSPLESEEKQAAITFVMWDEPSSAKQLKSLLKEKRNTISEELDIKENILLSNRLMSRIAEQVYFHKNANAETLEKVMGTWRYDFFKDILEQY